MELVIILYAGLLAYILIQKLRGRSIIWNSNSKTDVHSQEIRQKNQSEPLPAIKVVLQESSDNLLPESGETITLILTEGDAFHAEWELVEDEDAEESPNPPETINS
ncbi:MAG: hypothetical protein PHW74_14035 [Desulfobacca sp.]|nr:hypothetical protein [Desulfobacca sp.]